MARNERPDRNGVAALKFCLRSETAPNTRNIFNSRPLSQDIPCCVISRDLHREVYGNSRFPAPIIGRIRRLYFNFETIRSVTVASTTCTRCAKFTRADLRKRVFYSARFREEFQSGMICSNMKQTVVAKFRAQAWRRPDLPVAADGVPRPRGRIGAVQVVVARLFLVSRRRPVGRGRFTILISFLPRNSRANHPASCTANCPHYLKPFGLLLRQTLPIRTERLDGDCAATAKVHLRPETAPRVAKIPNACPLQEWVTSDVNPGNLNPGIYEKALIRSAFHGVYNQRGLFVFRQSSSMTGEIICIASGIPKESAANLRELLGHS